VTPGHWIRFLSGPDIDGLNLAPAEFVDAVRAEQAGAGTMLRYR
jgi:hypothetical protein